MARSGVPGRPAHVPPTPLSRTPAASTTPATSRTPAIAAFATLATALPALSTLEDLVDAATGAMCAAVEVDSVHVGRVDMAQGLVRVLRNAGLIEPWEEGRPAEETYLLRDHPELVKDPTDVEPWRGTMAERRGSRPYRYAPPPGPGYDERPLHGLRVPILHATGVWGAMLLRRRSGPFSEVEEQVAQVGAGLLAAGIARVLGDESLRELAYTDSLTALPNRRAADQRLEDWAGDDAVAADLVVVLCDVNGLKQVNDLHGHLVGDRLIRDAARCVATAASRLCPGFAARVGGDEFMVAGLEPDPAVVDSLVEELVSATARLPFGSGVSCGVASARSLLRHEDSPQTLVRSLLRIADAEQYRHKVASRDVRRAPGHTEAPTGTPDPPDPPDPPDEGRALGEVLELLPATTDGLPIEDGLALAAQAVARLAGATAWWVSRVDLARHTMQCVRLGVEHREEEPSWPMIAEDYEIYDLRSYPASERAVRAEGTFAADTMTGDAAERQHLMQTGFSSVIAAGLTDTEGRGWLVEISAVTGNELLRSEAVLRSAVARVRPRVARRP